MPKPKWLTKGVLIPVIPLLGALLQSCTSVQQEINSGNVRLSMTKFQLREALIMTSLAEDPFWMDVTEGRTGQIRLKS